jgi:hypothetical protein
MGLSYLDVWLSDIDDPCGTFPGETTPGQGGITVFDCKGILEWPCGRYLENDGTWVRVPHGKYKNLPIHCGHLEVELPPGCYWVFSGLATTFQPPVVHLNYATHVGIVEVGCGEHACVKLFNPSVLLCWDWFRVGLQVLSANKKTGIDPKKVAEIEKMVEALLKDVPRPPILAVIEAEFQDLVRSAQGKK